MMKGGDHHEGQLHYELKTKIQSIVPLSTVFSLPSLNLKEQRCLGQPVDAII